MEREERNSQKQEFKGKNLEEAISLAEHVLEISRAEMDYEIVTEKTKLFGLRNKEIVIRAWPKHSQGKNVVLEFLNKLFIHFPLELNYQIRSKSDFLYLIFDGADKDYLLRRDGSLLLALQHILNKISSQKVQADCDFFRRRKERRLREYAQKVACQVSETGKNEILDLMNPYERRIVHIAVNEIPGVATESIGEGFLKRVRIYAISQEEK